MLGAFLGFHLNKDCDKFILSRGRSFVLLFFFFASLATASFRKMAEILQIFGLNLS